MLLPKQNSITYLRFQAKGHFKTCRTKKRKEKNSWHSIWIMKLKRLNFPSVSNVKHNWNSKIDFTMEKYKHIWVFPQSSQSGHNWPVLKLESFDTATPLQALLWLSFSLGKKDSRIIFTNFYTQKGIMGEEEAPREKKKYLDVKSNTILTRFEFLRNIARVLVGFNHQIFVLDFCVLFFTHR